MRQRRGEEEEEEAEGNGYFVTMREKKNGGR